MARIVMSTMAIPLRPMCTLVNKSMHFTIAYKNMVTIYYGIIQL